MRSIRRFDLFRQVQDSEKHLTPATAYGAATTIFTALLLIVLIVGEFWDYFRGYAQCTLVPRAQPDNMTADALAELKMIDAVINFPYVPCTKITVHNTLTFGESSQVDSSMTVRKYIASFGEPTYDTTEVFTEDSALRAESNGCTVAVQAPLANGPASLNFLVVGYNTSHGHFPRLEHNIIDFEAGGADFADVKRFHRYITTASLRPLAGKYQHIPEEPRNPYFYQYFLQFVLTSTTSGHGYQYTQSHSVLQYRGGQRLPGLYFSYRPSGFSVQCTLRHDTMSHFIVNLCAVAGGVYTVASLLEAGMEYLARERRRRERAAQNAHNTQSAGATSM